MIRPEGVARLRSAFLGKPRGYAELLLRECYWDCDLLLSAGPARRQQRALQRAPEEADRLVLLWAAVVWGHRAAAVLQALEGQPLPGRVPPGSRTARAAFVAHEASAPETLWPFSPPSPWADDD